MPTAPHQQDGAGGVGLGASFTFRPVITERARQTPARSTKDLLDHLYTNPIQKRKKQQQSVSQPQDEIGGIDYHPMETPTPHIEDIDDDIPEPQLIYSHSMSPIDAHSPTDPHALLTLSPSKLDGAKKVTPRHFNQVYRSLLDYRTTADVRRREKAKQLMERQGLQDVPTINRHSKTLAAGRYKETGGDIWTELYHRSTISSASQTACPSPVSARSPSPAPRVSGGGRYAPHYQEVPQSGQSSFNQFECNQNSLFPSSSSGPLPTFYASTASHSPSPTPLSPPVPPHSHRHSNITKAVPIVVPNGQAGNDLYKQPSGSSWNSGEEQQTSGPGGVDNGRKSGEFDGMYGGAPRFEPKRAASATPLSSRMTQRNGVSRAPIASGTPRGMASAATRQGYPNQTQQSSIIPMMPGSGFPTGYLARGQGWNNSPHQPPHQPPPQQAHFSPGMYPGMSQTPLQYKHNQQYFGGSHRMGFHAMPW